MLFTRFFWSGWAFACLALTAGWLLSQREVSARETPPPVWDSAWLKGAGLSADQEKALQPKQANLKRDMDTFQIVMAKERLSMCSLLRDSAPSDEVIRQYAARLSQLEAAQQEMVVQHVMSIAAELTPPQRHKFFDSMMRDICTGCRNMSCKPGTPCMCGHCSHGA